MFIIRRISNKIQYWLGLSLFYDITDDPEIKTMTQYTKCQERIKIKPHKRKLYLYSPSLTKEEKNRLRLEKKLSRLRAKSSENNSRVVEIYRRLLERDLDEVLKND